jgi:hypothetical protein
VQVVGKLEKELSRLRSELRRSEVTVKKLQDAAGASSLNHNNTSSAFALPSEFKKSWEELVQENLLDVFSGFLDNHFYFVRLVQDLLKETLGRLDDAVEAKVKALCSVLGLGDDAASALKKSNLKVLQDFSTTTFPLSEEFVGQVKGGYLTRVEGYLPPDQLDELRQVLESDDFAQILITLHKVGLHISLNDPPLKLPFPEALEYLKFEKPEDFYCIDGFPKGQPPCVVVLPPVMREKFAYQGIRPAVLILKADADLMSVERQTEMTTLHSMPLLTTPKTPSLPPVLQDEASLEIESDEKQTDKTTSRDASVTKMYAYKLNRSRSPIARSHCRKDISPRQVTEIYNRYKDKLHQLKQSKTVTPVDTEDENMCAMPLQTKTPLARDTRLFAHVDLGQTLSTPLRTREAESIPISTTTLKALMLKREEQSNPFYKYRTATMQGNKASLLSLANRIPADTTHKTKTSRTYNAVEGDRTRSTVINKRLSDAASRLDRRAWARGHLGKEKETCKVM